MQKKLAELQASREQGINTLNAITGGINTLTMLIQEDQEKEKKAIADFELVKPAKPRLKRVK